MLIFRKNLRINLIYIMITMVIHRKGGEKDGAYKSWASWFGGRGSVFLRVVVGTVAEKESVICNIKKRYKGGNLPPFCFLE
jgi:hypothetical protein